MSSRTPKTGLAARMRAWMSRQRKPFTAGMIADALAIPPGPERDRVRCSIGDFIARVEIFPAKRIRRQVFYGYNPAWHRIHKGTLNKRIYKAMYVSGTFSLSDIQRLSEAPERSWLDKIARPLRGQGLIKPVGRRACAHGIGAEAIYHIPDRDKFRLEVMG
jgi:hypothetical protein